MHQGKPRRKKYEEKASMLLEALHVPFTPEVIVGSNDPDLRRKCARVDFCWFNSETAVCFEVDEHAPFAPTASLTNARGCGISILIC